MVVEDYSDAGATGVGDPMGGDTGTGGVATGGGVGLSAGAGCTDCPTGRGTGFCGIYSGPV